MLRNLLRAGRSLHACEKGILGISARRLQTATESQKTIISNATPLSWPVYNLNLEKVIQSCKLFSRVHHMMSEDLTDTLLKVSSQLANSSKAIILPACEPPVYVERLSCRLWMRLTAKTCLHTCSSSREFVYQWERGVDADAANTV